MNADRHTSPSTVRSKVRDVFRVLCRFGREEDAQDLIEYAFLAAFIGVAGYLTLGAIGGEVLNTYSSWVDPSVGVPKLWDPADLLVSSGS